MRLSRLAVLSVILTSLSLSANAQYTSKSSSGFTTKSNQASATASAKKAQPATQISVRPRPQAKKQEQAPTKPSATNDDELPSFSVFEGKPEENAEKQAENLPPPKGEIWIYLANFEQSDLTGMTMNCRWDVVIQNRTDTPIKNLSFIYSLLNFNFHLYVGTVKEGASSVKGHAVYTETCPAMKHLKPKITIKKCNMGPLKNQECAEYIVVK